ncbi:MAG: tetratricopeptide repeat protein [Sedimentisphaerales bacterium]|nr:tetratricopeptide repeat protein [Sedimentisphaerales bacterium]
MKKAAATAGLLHQALTCFQRGMDDSVESLCAQVLQDHPEHPDALHLLGLSAYRRGKYHAAVSLIRRAQQGDESRPGLLNSLAAALHADGQLDLAEKACQKLLQLNPQCEEAYNTLGMIYQQQDKTVQAEQAFCRAIEIRPDYADAHNNLGVVLNHRWQCDAAIKHYQIALQTHPEDPSLHNNMGITLYRMGRFDQALQSHTTAIRLAPTFAEAYYHRGMAWAAKDHPEEAIQDYQTAIRLLPTLADAFNSLGMILVKCLRFEEAIRAFRRALELDHDFAHAYYNLANLFRSLGHCDDAIEMYDRAIARLPEFADAFWNRSTVHLLNGQLEKGWQDYQWRHKADLDVAVYPHSLEKSRWDGSPFTGKTLLLHYEQGYGDSIQFLRYLPMVKARGGQILLEERPVLLPLLKAYPHVDQFLAAGSHAPSPDSYDIHISLLDLPQVFNTTLQTIPNQVPYLWPDPEKISHWRSCLPAGEFRVGIVWAGSPHHGNDTNRSCPQEWFLPLSRIPGVQLISLQKEAPETERFPGSGRNPIHHLGPILNDFSDTAAVIASLDLVISVDTAVAHLAGALGKEVWTLLPFAPDWRWMLHRIDSPWYPTMRLFRQPAWGDWNSVFQEVLGALHNRVASYPLL